MKVEGYSTLECVCVVAQQNVVMFVCESGSECVCVPSVVLHTVFIFHFIFCTLASSVCLCMACVGVSSLFRFLFQRLLLLPLLDVVLTKSCRLPTSTGRISCVHRKIHTIDRLFPLNVSCMHTYATTLYEHYALRCSTQTSNS